jgi:serine/threonine protein kinase
MGNQKTACGHLDWRQRLGRVQTFFGPGAIVNSLPMSSTRVQVSSLVGGKKALASRESQPKVVKMSVETKFSNDVHNRELSSADESFDDSGDDLDCEKDNGEESGGESAPILHLSSSSGESSSSDSDEGAFRRTTPNELPGNDLALRTSLLNSSLNDIKNKGSDILTKTINVSQTLDRNELSNIVAAQDVGPDVSTPQSKKKTSATSPGSARKLNNRSRDGAGRPRKSGNSPRKSPKGQDRAKKGKGEGGDSTAKGNKKKRRRKRRRQKSPRGSQRPVVLTPEQFKDLYGLGDKIGSGAYGIVYRGLDKQTGAFLAVKEIHCGHDSISGMTDVVSEVQILQRLFHPNIVRYVGAAVLWDRLYIFTEWVSGGSLTQILAQFGALPVGLVAQHTLQILKGLAYLHKQGIIHRDIKGQNILVSKDGRIKLADFGAARLLSNITKGPALFGTPAFLAPEVITDTRCDTKADVWSLGCTIIQMITGKTPWSPKGFSSVYELLHHVSTSQETPPRHDIPPRENTSDLNDFLNVCFERDPDVRCDTNSLFLHRFVCTPQVSKRLSIKEKNSIAPFDGGTASDSGGAAERQTLVHQDSFEDSFNRSGALKIASAFFRRATGGTNQATAPANVPPKVSSPRISKSESPVIKKRKSSGDFQNSGSGSWGLSVPSSSDILFMESADRQMAYKQTRRSRKSKSRSSSTRQAFDVQQVASPTNDRRPSSEMPNDETLVKKGSCCVIS